MVRVRVRVCKTFCLYINIINVNKLNVIQTVHIGEGDLGRYVMLFSNNGRMDQVTAHAIAHFVVVSSPRKSLTSPPAQHGTTDLSLPHHSPAGGLWQLVAPHHLDCGWPHHARWITY